MNTYTVSVKGKPILIDLTPEELEEDLKNLRAFVWTSGGSDRDIKIELNKSDSQILT